MLSTRWFSCASTSPRHWWYSSLVISNRPKEMTSSSSRMLRAWKARWKPGGLTSPGAQARRNWSHAPAFSRRAENMTIMLSTIRSADRRQEALEALGEARRRGDARRDQPLRAELLGEARAAVD